MKKAKIGLLVAIMALGGLLASCTQNATDDLNGGDNTNLPAGDDEGGEDEGGDDEGDDEGGEEGGHEGEGGGEEDSAWEDALPALEGAMERNGKYLPLSEMAVSSEDTAELQYAYEEVALVQGDVLRFYVNGESVTVWAGEGSNCDERGNSEAVASVTVTTSFEYACVYLKHYTGDASWVVYITGLADSGDNPGGGDTPVEENAYSFKVNGEAVKTDHNPYADNEYMALGVELAAGDIVTCWNTAKGERFIFKEGNVRLCDHITGKLARNEDGNVVVAEDGAGSYDFYLQLAYENDQLWIQEVGHTA